MLGVKPVRSLEVRILLCAYLCGTERTLSGTERTALDPSFPVYTDKFSRRSLQPAAPTAVRSLSPRFLFPDDRRHTQPPPRIRDGTRRHDPGSQQEPVDAARRGLRSAKAPNNCVQPAETRRCIGHPGRRCWIWRGRKDKRHQNERFETGDSVSIKAESLYQRVITPQLTLL